MTEPNQPVLSAPPRERSESGQTDPLIGRRLGPYRLQKTIGAGGMGVVYLALDVALQRPAAVKVVSPLTARGVWRFIEEARRQARLDHANVVSVYGAGTELIDGLDTHYIAMKYVEGPSLADLVRGHGPLDPIDATSFILDAARGLYFVHAEGFIHRDVKPGNVLIDAADRALVADFGVAGDLAAEVDSPTAGGEFMGTRAYASPEQLAGGRVDVRSDVFSLGATWLFALTAHEPEASGPAGRLPIDPAMPPLLRETLGRMVETSPEARFSTMLECIDALERTQASLVRGSRAPQDKARARPRRRRRARVAAIVVLALAGGMTGYAWWSAPTDSGTERDGTAHASMPAAAVERLPPARLEPTPTPEPEPTDASVAPEGLPSPAESTEVEAPKEAAEGVPPMAPERDAHQEAAAIEARISEADAWAEIARTRPGRIPGELAAFERDALESRDPRLLEACNRIAIELAAAWSPAYDAATYESGSLVIDRFPLTNAQYFQFLRDEMERDPSLFTASLRPPGEDWVEFAEPRGIRRPRLSALALPVTGITTRAAEFCAQSRGQRIPGLDEWKTMILPFYLLTYDKDAPYERVIWKTPDDDHHHFAAMGEEELLVRKDSLVQSSQGLRLVR